MSYDVPLIQAANQSFTMRSDSARFEVSLRDCQTCMAVDITRDGERIVSGHRALPLSPLIPFQYLEGDAGNFYFDTGETGELPDWRKFGTLHFLLFATAAEIQEVRNVRA